jgi:transposase
MLPPSPVDWLPENHLAFFLLDLAAELDLEEIYAVYRQKDPRGEKAYDPRMMVLLLLYGYCVGLPSSRRIEKACWEDAAFRLLTGNLQPDHSRISDFRRRYLADLAGLFVQVLRLCKKAGLVSLGHVALDGIKIRANASKHKAMSHAAHAQKREATGGRDSGPAAQGRTHRCPGRRPIRQEQTG